MTLLVLGAGGQVGRAIVERAGPGTRGFDRAACDIWAVPKKRPKGVRDDRSMLNNIILPKLGAKKAAVIGRRDVETIQVAMKDRPYLVNRVLSLLSKMFSLAVEWRWRPDNPVKGIERYDER